MRIALTGGIGSGKSTAANIFSCLGFHTIDLDAISKEILDKNSEVFFKIVSIFGEQIVGEGGKINRPALKNIIFKNDIKRKALEAIIHPAVYEEEKMIRKLILSKDPKAEIITESAILVETGLYKHYELLILIYADRQTQFKRAMRRDIISPELLNHILDAQMPSEEKAKYADIIIDNNNDKDTLQFDIERAATLIYELIYAKKHNK